MTTNQMNDTPSDGRALLAHLLSPDSLHARVWQQMQAGGSFWLVGGTVRDALLGRPCYDLDFAVPTAAIPRARRLADDLGGAFFILDAKRDAGRVLLARADDAPLVVDVARLRAATIEADLAGRDFTVNAMAVGSHSPYLLLDPCGGLDDLQRRRIAIVSPDAFRQDWLRLLRAVRFTAQLGFALAPETEAAIRRDAHRIAGAAMERVRDELVRILRQPGAARHVRQMDALGLLPHVLPELAACHGVSQSPPHHLDVFDHTLEVVRHAEALLGALGLRAADASGAYPSRLVTLPEALATWRAPLTTTLAAPTSDVRTLADLFLWATLAHDWGKPHTQTVEADGRIRFFEHDRVSAEMAAARLTALRFSADETRALATIVRHHMRPSYLLHDGPPSRRATYRFFRATEAMTELVLLLHLCDYLGVRGPFVQEAEWQAQAAFVASLLHGWHREPALARPQPLLSGHDLMAALRLPAGPAIGRLLARLQEAQAVGEVRSRAEALAQARTWLAEEDT